MKRPNIAFEADAGNAQRRFAVLAVPGAAQLKRWAAGREEAP